MSTSDRTQEQQGTPPETGNWAAGLHALEGVPGGIPAPALLARMANEVFNALPQELQAPLATAAAAALPPNSVFTGNPYAALPSPTAPAVPGFLSGLSEAHPGALGRVQDTGAAPSARPAAPVPIPLDVPSGGIDPASLPAFAFLADARPLFVEPATQLSPANAPSLAFGSAVPSDEDYEAIPAFSFLEDARPLCSSPPALPGPVPADAKDNLAPPHEKAATNGNPFATPLNPNAPQFPGAVVHAPDFRAPVSHDPQDQPRPLYPANAAPVIAPGAGQSPILPNLELSSVSFDVEAIRRDFPILREVVNGHPLIWLDNGATTQKPQSVIDRISYFYEHENSNVHRAAHELAARATDAYESAREKTRRFLNAGATREIIFVRGATEAINLVAQSWGRRNIQKDDEIVITWLEHHANIVPWQMLCAEKGALLRVAPVDDSGQVLLDEYEKLLGPKTRLVSIAHVSNALGTVVPVNQMVEAAHRHGARVLVDGAQAVSHMHVDVQSIDCDFYVFSGHKVFAITGIGVVYGKSEELDNMPPWQGGGNMIQDVTFEKTLYQPPPQRFEAGTGNIADAVGLGAAIDYLDRIGIANVSRHEHMLLTYATAALERIPGLHIIGAAKEKAGVLSFVMDGFRTEEIGDYLNLKGIAVRGGHHCAQPILRRFGVESTLRASLALYNTCEEVDALVAALWDLRQGRSPGLV